MLILGNLSDPEGLGEGSPTEGYQFPVVSFRDITAATDNFHESYMIGQGGFEKVYKSTHPKLSFHSRILVGLTPNQSHPLSILITRQS